MSTGINGRILYLENPLQTPAVDYEDNDIEEDKDRLVAVITPTTSGPDSGNGDSDHEYDVKSLL